MLRPHYAPLNGASANPLTRPATACLTTEPCLPALADPAPPAALSVPSPESYFDPVRANYKMKRSRFFSGLVVVLSEMLDAGER